MSIGSKEARETLYWIRLLTKSGYLNEYSKLELLDSEICSIVKIITSIVKTTQNLKLKTNSGGQAFLIGASRKGAKALRCPWVFDMTQFVLCASAFSGALLKNIFFDKIA